jgi:hypothetical protein
MLVDILLILVNGIAALDMWRQRRYGLFALNVAAAGACAFVLPLMIMRGRWFL